MCFVIGLFCGTDAKVVILCRKVERMRLYLLRNVKKMLSKCYDMIFYDFMMNMRCVEAGMVGSVKDRRRKPVIIRL